MLAESVYIILNWQLAGDLAFRQLRQRPGDKGGTREPSEKMESTGERQAQRQKGQGRRRGRRICESFPFTRPPPQSRPCQHFLSPSLCQPLFPLPGRERPIVPSCRRADISPPAFCRADYFSCRCDDQRAARERQQEAAGGAAAGGHVTWAGQSHNQSGILCVGRSLSALNRGGITDLKPECQI